MGSPSRHPWLAAEEFSAKGDKKVYLFYTMNHMHISISYQTFVEPLAFIVQLQI